VCLRAFFVQPAKKKGKRTLGESTARAQYMPAPQVFFRLLPLKTGARKAPLLLAYKKDAA
jgi:hypothetical protein